MRRLCCTLQYRNINKRAYFHIYYAYLHRKGYKLKTFKHHTLAPERSWHRDDVRPIFCAIITT
jgi:hypothetical protein